MTQPPTELPNYVIRSYESPVHEGLPDDSQLFGLSQDQMDNFTEWNQNVATKTSVADGTTAVAGTNTSGTVNSKTVGIGPPTSTDVLTTNMMVSQDFTSSDSVVTDTLSSLTGGLSAVTANHWSWDGTDGDLVLGCARCDCDGIQDPMVSNEIPVLVGETIEVSCEAKCEGIVYTGTKPVVLGIQKYRQGKDPDTGTVTYLDIGSVDVAWLDTPAADVAWGQGEMAGTYVVEAGVDQLRFRFDPKSTITEGIVKWDEAVFLKLDRIKDAAVPGVQTTVDDIVTQLYGTQGEDFTHNQSAVALGNTAASILSINARLSESEASDSPGNIAGDDFSWSGEITASADWGGGYTASAAAGGRYAADGSDASWVEWTAGFDPSQRCWFDWQGTGQFSSTDYQLVRLLLSSAPVKSPTDDPCFIHLLGRISTDFSQYVRAGFGSDGTYFVDFTNNSGASFTTMVSGSCPVPGAGALVSLYCGDEASTAPRHFKLTVNATTIRSFDESGTGSSLGAGNLKWGWGAQNHGGYFINDFGFGDVGAGIPPKINQWLGYDQ